MYADDFAQVIFQVIGHEIYDSFNVATPENLSIKEMAGIALSACNSNHLDIVWDNSKPNGQFRKDVSIDLLKNKIPDFNPISLHQGIKLTYQHLINKDK
jgi:nucleoside-diphosphate-sugar epimerase